MSMNIASKALVTGAVKYGASIVIAAWITSLGDARLLHIAYHEVP